MAKSKKKNNFTIEDLQLLCLIFDHLKMDTKCNEVKIFTEDKNIGIEPIKILEKIVSKVNDKYGAYKLKYLLGNDFFNYFCKNKKSKALKDKEIESIDISENFIRFNLKKEE